MTSPRSRWGGGRGPRFPLPHTGAPTPRSLVAGCLGCGGGACTCTCTASLLWLLACRSTFRRKVLLCSVTHTPLYTAVSCAAAAAQHTSGLRARHGPPPPAAPSAVFPRTPTPSLTQQHGPPALCNRHRACRLHCTALGRQLEELQRGVEKWHRWGPRGEGEAASTQHVRRLSRLLL